MRLPRLAGNGMANHQPGHGDVRTIGFIGQRADDLVPLHKDQESSGSPGNAFSLSRMAGKCRTQGVALDGIRACCGGMNFGRRRVLTMFVALTISRSSLSSGFHQSPTRRQAAFLPAVGHAWAWVSPVNQ